MDANGVVNPKSILYNKLKPWVPPAVDREIDVKCKAASLLKFNIALSYLI